MYLTPQKIAEHIEDRRDDSHVEIADHLDVDRSAVSHALRDASSRRIGLLARIAGIYGIDVDSEHVAYAVDEDSV